MKIDKSYFIENVKEIINTNKIDLNHITIEDIANISSEFFGMFESHGKIFIGISGYLQNKYSCLLNEWFNECKKHEGINCSDVPELVSMKNNIEKFEEYTEKFLGFKYCDGTFKEIKK